MTVIILGMGAVGKALFSIVSEKHDVDGLDLEAKQLTPQKSYDVMHICFPYSETFIEDTVFYIQKFNPKLTLIESTIIPKTTRDVFQRLNKSVLLCHSPVRGRDSVLRKELLVYTKFIGGCTETSSVEAQRYYESLGMKTYIAKSPLETEFAKLMNLNYFATLIAMFQEFERITEQHNVELKDIHKFFETTTVEGKRQDVTRPILHGEHIGGHCVIPAVKMLSKFMTENTLSEWILDSNLRRKTELNANCS